MYINDDTIPFFDETHFTNNIDITLDGDLTKFEEVRRVLQMNGLDIVKGTREMKALVIKDRGASSFKLQVNGNRK